MPLLPGGTALAAASVCVCGAGRVRWPSTEEGGVQGGHQPWSLRQRPVHVCRLRVRPRLHLQRLGGGDARQCADSGLLVAPQLSTLASLAWLSGLLTALRTRGSRSAAQRPVGGCGAAVRPGPSRRFCGDQRAGVSRARSSGQPRSKRRPTARVAAMRAHLQPSLR